MRFSLAVIFVLFCNFIYSQIDYFSETDTDLSPYYQRLYKWEEQAKKNRAVGLNKSDERLLEDIYQQSALYAKDLNRSAYVIFNSAGVQYLNEIKNMLLKSMPELNKLIKIYITDDPAINAFAALDGSIYVNTGLLAKVNNEAQLAFILSHEIIHVLKAHLIDEKINLAKAAEVYNSSQAMSKKEFMKLKKHVISIENETESDLSGFDLYLKSGYPHEESVLALDLLKDADNFNPELALSNKIYFMNKPVYDSLYSTYSQYQDSLTAVIAKKEKTDEEELSSHPELSVRIENILKKISELSLSANQPAYLISEEKFQEIHKQAIQRQNKLYAKNFDFIKLFLNSSYKCQTLNDYSKENLSCIGYSMQGLVYDLITGKKKRHVYGTINQAEQVYQYYYLHQSDAFLRHSIKLVDSLAKVYPDSGLDKYLNSIYYMLMANKESKSASAFLENPAIDFSNFPEAPKADLNLSDVDFEILPHADLPRRKLKKFNTDEKSKDAQKGKTAIANFQIFRVYRGYNELGMREYKLSHKRMDRLDERTSRALKGLKKRFGNDIVAVVPNAEAYDGNQLNSFKLLNDWVSERSYYNDHTFTSFFNQEMEEYADKTGVQNIMIGLLVEIKAFSMAKFMPAYFSPFAVPFFLPQIVANVTMAATRKYMLTLTFDIESQKLVFYDKRCYLEPDSAALIEIMLTDILYRFNEK